MALALAAGLFLIATIGLMLAIEPFPTWYYHVAWWCYIVALDDVNRRRSGRSLLRDRRRHFGWLSAVSILWWLFFELLNLRLGNWYYVMNQASPLVRFLGGMAAFATVLPGIVVTLTFVEHLGWLRDVRTRPLVWSSQKERLVLALGSLSFVLPLVWPDTFYPLVWGAAVFLIEPWNRRHARRSYLRDLEAGNAGPFCQALLAGAVCGGLWETWNFWARMKWIYTVPGFEGLKFFEMPVAGLLGFPPFAVESLVFLRALGALRDRAAPPVRRTSRVAFAIAGPLAAASSFLLVDPVTVDSTHERVSELDVLPAATRERLVAAGITTPERAVHVLTGDERERVRLVLLKGIGDARAMQLEQVGIRSVADLAREDPYELFLRLRGLGPPAPRDRFLLRRVRLWVKAARRASGRS